MAERSKSHLSHRYKIRSISVLHCIQHLHDRLDCEECQNDTYNGIWNAIPPTKPTVFLPFITQIMQNIAIDRYKYKMSKKRVPTELMVSIEELEEALCSYEPVEGELVTEEVAKMISDYIGTLSKR